MKALDYASGFTNFTQQDRDIIIHAKRSLLYHQNTLWTKKDTANMFDVTMGSYDGAETYELIGLYKLSLIGPKFTIQVGLYCDDGLAVCNVTPREIEKINLEVSNAFKANGLKIAINVNKKSANFLNVTFNLVSKSYKPYIKPNKLLTFISRVITPSVNTRLSSISSSKEIFDKAISPYQMPLKKAETTANSHTTPLQSKQREKRELEKEHCMV